MIKWLKGDKIFSSSKDDYAEKITNLNIKILNQLHTWLVLSLVPP